MRPALRFALAGLGSLAILGAARADPIVAIAAAPPPPLSAVDADSLARAAREARADGAAAPDLDAAAAASVQPLPEVSRAGQELLSAGAVALAIAQRGRLPDPTAANRDWALRQTDVDPAAAFAAARAAGTVPAWAAALRPTHPGYLTLAAARRRYAALVAAGGWAPTPSGPDLTEGSVDPRVAALRERLAAEGVVTTPAQSPESFDAGLTVALKDYQLRRGLKESGKLDPATVAALNVTAEALLAAIDLNLERERWLPASLPADRIEVDIGGQTARVYIDGAPALDMRVIVGDLKHHTPSFASAVTAVVFNPPWVVPSSIASAELWPKERRSPGYLARNGFSVNDGQLVQAPSPRAALGYLKFEMNSPFGVYLHDTPSRSLFARDRRTLSHGCMRLQEPRQLASILLAHQGWSLADVDAVIAAGPPTRRVALQTPMPVFVVYRTVVSDGDGVITVRPDVYGWDARLAAVLSARQGQDAAMANEGATD